MKYGGIILAGGTGKRFGEGTPKQFISLNGTPLLRYSLDVFLKHVDITVVVTHSGWLDETLKITDGLNVKVTIGGNSRQDSSINGLMALDGLGIKIVAIHDGARPFISENLLKRALSLAEEKGAAVPVLPVTSTLCGTEGNKINRYIDRENLFTVQTPQAFDYDLIYNAHREARKLNKTGFTDDSRLLENCGIFADVIGGEEENIKITSRFDLDLAECILKRKNIIGGLL